MEPILHCHGQVARLPDHPGPNGMCGDPGHVHTSGVEFDEEEHVEPLQQHRIDREEVAASMEDAWLRRNSFQLGPARIGEGSIVCLRRMAQMVEGANATPSLASSPWILR